MNIIELKPFVINFIISRSVVDIDHEIISQGELTLHELGLDTLDLNELIIEFENQTGTKILSHSMNTEFTINLIIHELLHNLFYHLTKNDKINCAKLS